MTKSFFTTEILREKDLESWPLLELQSKILFQTFLSTQRKAKAFSELTFEVFFFTAKVAKARKVF